MEGLFLRIAVLSLSTSAVLLPLLLCLPQIRRRWAEQTCYILWLFLALRLIVPVQWALPHPVIQMEVPRQTAVFPVQWGHPIVSPEEELAPSAHASEASDKAPAASIAPKLTPGALMAWIWLAGMAGVLLWHGGSYLLARRRLLKRASLQEGRERDVLLQQCRVLGLKKTVQLYRTTEVVSPMTLGFFRPVIVLPEGVRSGTAFNMVLRHELIHLKRRDVGCQALFLLCCGGHWFNPLVWWMRREALRTLELCCDDAVVRDWDKTERRRYGELLLQTAEVKTLPFGATCFGSGKRQLKVRLRNLFQQKRNCIPLICGVLLAALLVGGLVVCEVAGTGPDSPRAAMNCLLDSLSYDYDTNDLQFTIPKGYEGWTVHIAGRSTAGGGMSVHYTQDTPQEEWRAGKTYCYQIPWPEDPLMTELTMTVSLSHGELELEDSVDLIRFITEGRRPIYHSAMYGFTLRIPEIWDDVKIVERVGQVEFLQTDTGNGLLALIITDTLPSGQSAAAQSGGWYLLEGPLAMSMPGGTADPEALRHYSEMVEAGSRAKETICFSQICTTQKLPSVRLKELQAAAVVQEDGRCWTVDPAAVLVEVKTDAWPRSERITYGGLQFLLEQNPEALFDLYLREGTVVGIASVSTLNAGPAMRIPSTDFSSGSPGVGQGGMARKAGGHG